MYSPILSDCSKTDRTTRKDGTMNIISKQRPLRLKSGIWPRVKKAKYLYLLLLIPIIYVFIFNYTPMYGVIMAFKKFTPSQGIMGSAWVGLYNFQRFFSSPECLNIIWNTVRLSLYGLIAGFPFPIILAVALNYCKFSPLKKSVQSITFMPYFLSAVLMVGLMTQVLGTRSGIVNYVITLLGLEPINFMGNAAVFDHVYVWSGIWQGTGYSAIIYISALSGVDPSYHEAAMIDGASIWQRIWHIDLTTIRPTVVILLILNIGSILNIGFEKIYLMQNPLNTSVSSIISTYVYGVSLKAAQPDYSFGTAIGLFQNGVAVILTLIVNCVANRITGDGLF